MDIKYFDNAATTPVKKEVLNEMLPYFSEKFGNASSVYSIAKESKTAIEIAREKVAKALNAEISEIYFTSGGTESDNIALRGIAYSNKQRGRHIITSKIEHHAILNTCKQLEKEGFSVTYLPVDKNGLVKINELKKAITKNTVLISIMTANNEIGTIQPIEEIGKIAKENNIFFHTDAVQAIGSVKIDVKSMNVDSLSLSGHKFGGPKGIGAIYVRNGINIQNLMYGGGQERGKRPSTENVPAIVGLGKAIELASNNIDEHNKKIIKLRDEYISLVERNIPYIIINGDRVKRLPNNANISFKFIQSEGLLLKLDAKGICASSGSACNSGSIEPSHVLSAIGLQSEDARGTLRITIGEMTTMSDIVYLVNVLKDIVYELRQMSQSYKEYTKVIK